MPSIGTEKIYLYFSTFNTSPVGRGWQTVFCKRAGGEYLQPCRPYGLWATNEPHSWPTATGDTHGYWVCCVPLQREGLENGFSYHFHWSQMLFLF